MAGQQQPPIRNRSVVAAAVYGHSGEFAPAGTDLRLPGRGLDLVLVRTYRSSLADRAGELGRGWSASVARRVEADGDDLVYDDGAGMVHRFVRAARGGYTSPDGFYGLLEVERKGVLIRHRYGRSSRFEPIGSGGRIRSIEDRNHNIITFAYRTDRIEIVDTLRRPISISLAKGRLREVRDHAGRTWGYSYDVHDRLVEVVRPATATFPRGTSLRYGYDAEHRLASLTDANGQEWLTVRYDDADRVIEQTHGTGTYSIAYEEIGRRRSPAVRTTCRLKNGTTLVVDHNTAGNAVTRTLSVSRAGFAADDVAGVTGDLVPLVTRSAYNRNAELVARTQPAGNATTWVFAEDDDDPRNQGNCLQATETPAPGAPADQHAIVTSWTFGSRFQVPLSVTDPRGHTTTHRYDAQGNRVATGFAPVTVQPLGGSGPRPAPATLTLEVGYAFNAHGQLLRKTHIDGTVTTYAYYPVADPTGARGRGTATSDPEAICGYLARVTRDAADGRRRNEYRWDAFGNIVAVFDGRRNAARLRYDEMGRLEQVRGREPFGDTIDYRYDANGNEIESVQSFERLELDEATGETVARAGAIRELKAYDVLDYLVARTIAGGDARISERFIRDADERVVRLVQPTGTVTEFEYDERNLLVAWTRAAGTKEAVTERRTYTPAGDVRSETDGNGGTTTHHYDGFGRYAGLTDRLGTRKAQSFDEAGNVVQVAIDGDGGGKPRRRLGAAVRRARPALLQTEFAYDEWSRVVRIDQAWRDPAGKALGASGWDGRDGVASLLLAHLPNGQPGSAWSETGNVASAAYDGLGRVAAVEDLTGEVMSFAYDENGNQTRVTRRGPRSDDGRAESTVHLSYDEMDRLVASGTDDEGPERFRHSALGGVAVHMRASGMDVELLEDALGRRVGQVLVVRDAEGDAGAEAKRIARRLEYDDAYRLTAHTDGAGNRTTYRYDALDRQMGVVYPDGTEATAEYDANGNAIRVVDAGGTEAVNRYDAGDRLVERRTRAAGSDAAATAVEVFAYDAVGRLVRATTAGREIRRTYDSLSRVLTEDQAGRMVRAAYDAAGRPTQLDYPGGESVRRTFDVRGRVTEVVTGSGAPVVSVQYRVGEQIARLVVGGVLEASCTYDRHERLESVTYRRVDTGALVEGYRYAYDDAGRIVNEIRASDGVGERYAFDASNRPIRARYGVADVLDPASPYDLETTYEHFPEGPWRRRRDVDGRGIVITDQAGIVDERNRYRRFGGTRFAYDAAGNTIRKGTDNPGFCLYTYDGQNRLVKAECFDANAQRTQTIGYEYDALGRLVRKTVTDAAGVATETTYTWAGNTLLEEYENGVLVRTYVYGIGSQPARLTVVQNGRTDYLYVHNGRGLAAGLVRADDPNAFAEKYGYEITGGAFVTEVGGMPVGLPERSSTASGVLNSILSGDAFGTLMRDWANGTFSGLDGRHLDPMLAGMLNSNASLTGGTHGTVRQAMGKQFNSYLGMLGLAGRGSHLGQGSHGGQGSTGQPGSGKSTGGSLGGSLMGRKYSLYAADGGSGSLFPSTAQNPAFDFTKGGGGSSGTSGASGGTSTGGAIGQVKSFLDTPVSVGPAGGLETTVGSLLGGVVGGVATGVSSAINGGPPKDSGTGPPAAGEGNQAEKDQKAAAEKAKQEQADRAAAEKATNDKTQKDADAKKKEEEEAAKKKSIVEEGDKYVDPDAQTGAAVGTISPEQIEARLNSRKHPVNPNTGGGSPQIDMSSPPPRHGGVDPTIALFDGETFGGLAIGGGEPENLDRPDRLRPRLRAPPPDRTPDRRR